MALTAELAEKQAEKLKSLGVTEVCAWVAEVSGIAQDGPMAEWLQLGVVLCELANALQPGAVSKINRQGKMMFKQLENISAFIRATKALGVSATFETNDLYEQNNLVLVVQCLQALKDQTTARGGAGAGLAKLGAATPPTRGAKMPVPVVPTAGGAERAAPRPTAELEGVAADGYSQAEGAEGGRGGWGINADLEAKKKEEYAKLPEVLVLFTTRPRGARTLSVSRALSRVLRRRSWRGSARPLEAVLPLRRDPRRSRSGCATARSSARSRTRSSRARCPKSTSRPNSSRWKTFRRS